MVRWFENRTFLLFVFCLYLCQYSGAHIIHHRLSFLIKIKAVEVILLKSIPVKLYIPCVECVTRDSCILLHELQVILYHIAFFTILGINQIVRNSIIFFYIVVKIRTTFNPVGIRSFAFYILLQCIRGKFFSTCPIHIVYSTVYRCGCSLCLYA